jgi:hypothetical protein
MLLDVALTGHPDADYYVFCDDDVEFLTGDFAEFEKCLAATRPAIGFPLMPKARLGSLLDERLAVQRALDIDEQMYAVHRSLIGTPGLAPLDSRHDHVSWYVASLTFEYLVGTRLLGTAHQFNTVELCNNGHVWQDGATLYAANRGVPADFIPVLAGHIDQFYGGYDPTVIEQFMPPLSSEAYVDYVARRRADAETLFRFDGSQSEDRPAVSLFGKAPA